MKWQVATDGSESAADRATAQLQHALMSGTLRPDDPVREEDWATRLGLSRTPVREAIQELVARGILQRRGRTAHVFRPSLPELLEIYDIRLPLERLAVTRSVQHADNAFNERLAALFEVIREPRSGADWFADHEAFHMAIFYGSRMPRLVAIIANLRAQSEPYVRFAIHVDQRFRDESRGQHTAILDAIRDGDQKAAVAIVDSHLATTRSKITELMEAYGEYGQSAMRVFGS